MAEKKKRFEQVEAQGGFVTSFSVWADQETGVNYLVVNSGQGCGVTPLLGRDGKPVISAVPVSREDD